MDWDTTLEKTENHINKLPQNIIIIWQNNINKRYYTIKNILPK